MVNGIVDLKGSDYKSSTLITHPSDWVEEPTSGEVKIGGIDIWKLSDCFPFWSTHWDSSFLDSQQISGPIIPPNGKKNPANAERWQNIAQFLSDSDNSLISLMTIRF